MSLLEKSEGIRTLKEVSKRVPGRISSTVSNGIKRGRMLRLRDMIPIIGWIVAGLLLVTVVLGLVFVKNQNATFRANMDRLEYREGQMEQFFMEQRKENARIAKSDIDREN